METKPEDITKLGFEGALQELEALVARLESGDLLLDESINAYGRAEALRAHCEARLKEAQMRIERIVSDPDGAPALAPFEGAHGS